MSEDHDLAVAAAAELADAAPFELTIYPDTLLHIAGLIQLALRHPGLSESNRSVARRFLNGVRSHFDHCPTVLEILRRGDDPTYDRPRP